MVGSLTGGQPVEGGTIELSDGPRPNQHADRHQNVIGQRAQQRVTIRQRLPVQCDDAQFEQQLSGASAEADHAIARYDEQPRCPKEQVEGVTLHNRPEHGEENG